jgi:hypothetical protein
MEPSVLRGPWPGNRHATLRRGSHERKIVAGYAKSAYPITGKVAQRVLKMIKRQMFGRANLDLLNRRFILAA